MNQYQDYQFKSTTREFLELNHFTVPTPIQKEVIPPACKGKDLIAISDTGTGKTHAFLIPLMEKINTDIDNVQAVITAPTRELAQQLFNRAKLMMDADPSLRVRLVVGGQEKSRAIESLNTQPHIVIGTPGRIKDLFVSEGVLRLENVKMMVVDEADMTLEFGFLDDVDAICGRMPADLQMLAFSATIPQGLRPFLKKYMKHPQTIQIKSETSVSPKIEHILVPCRHQSYEEACLQLVDGFIPYVCLVFANTREEAASCAAALRGKGIRVVELHGGLEPRQRRQAHRQLENLEQSFVVATDIAARGIDVEGVTHVISMGFPSEKDFFIHRAGRTGRAGKEGTCFTLYKEDDMNTVQYFKERGIHFEHRVFKNGQWQNLKPLTQTKKMTKSEQMEKEIAKSLIRKKEKVKPGYKKKRNEEIQKIKRKQKRAMIDAEIQAIRKEKYKQQQRAKREGNSEW